MIHFNEITQVSVQQWSTVVLWHAGRFASWSWCCCLMVIHCAYANPFVCNHLWKWHPCEALMGDLICFDGGRHTVSTSSVFFFVLVFFFFKYIYSWYYCSRCMQNCEFEPEPDTTCFCVGLWFYAFFGTSLSFRVVARRWPCRCMFVSVKVPTGLQKRHTPAPRMKPPAQ